MHLPPLPITDNDIGYVNFVMLAFPQEKISHYTTAYNVMSEVKKTKINI